MTEPEPFVLRMLEVTEEIARFVVVACEVVEFPVMTTLPLNVEDAETSIPSVVVGRSEFATIDQSRLSEFQYDCEVVDHLPFVVSQKSAEVVEKKLFSVFQ